MAESVIHMLEPCISGGDDDSEYEDLDLPEADMDYIENFLQPGESGDAAMEPSTSVYPTIPFREIHTSVSGKKDKELPLRRKWWMSGQKIHVKIVDVDRHHRTHMLNPNLYIIELIHGHYKWVIKRRYKHFVALHDELRLFKATMKIPLPNKRHRMLRRQFSHSEKEKKAHIPQFPTRPEILVEMEDISKRMEQLEKYLQAILCISAYRNHNATLKFLEVSRLSFVHNLGQKRKEGSVLKRAGGRRIKIGCCGMFANCAGHWNSRWLVVRDTFVAYLQPSGAVGEVLLMDRDFKVDHGIVGTGVHHGVKISNLSRHLVVKAWTYRKAREWDSEIQQAAASSGADFTNPNRYNSYAPMRCDSHAQWFMDGADYFQAVSAALEVAKEEIFITDWWLSPEIFLRRPITEGDKWRLDKILERKADQGVKIFILLYKEVTLAVGLNSIHSKTSLTSKHPENIKVMRYPDHNPGGIFLWAHHEKLVVVDQRIAFVGGIDLCFGRWDDEKHRLADLGSVRMSAYFDDSTIEANFSQSTDNINMDQDFLSPAYNQKNQKVSPLVSDGMSGDDALDGMVLQKENDISKTVLKNGSDTEPESTGPPTNTQQVNKMHTSVLADVSSSTVEESLLQTPAVSSLKQSEQLSILAGDSSAFDNDLLNQHSLLYLDVSNKTTGEIEKGTEKARSEKDNHSITPIPHLNETKTGRDPVDQMSILVGNDSTFNYDPLNQNESLPVIVTPGVSTDIKLLAATRKPSDSNAAHASETPQSCHTVTLSGNDEVDFNTSIGAPSIPVSSIHTESERVEKELPRFSCLNLGKVTNEKSNDPSSAATVFSIVQTGKEKDFSEQNGNGIGDEEHLLCTKSGKQFTVVNVDENVDTNATLKETIELLLSEEEQNSNKAHQAETEKDSPETALIQITTEDAFRKRVPDTIEMDSFTATRIEKEFPDINSHYPFDVETIPVFNNTQKGVYDSQQPIFTEGERGNDASEPLLADEKVFKTSKESLKGSGDGKDDNERTTLLSSQDSYLVPTDGKDDLAQQWQENNPDILVNSTPVEAVQKELGNKDEEKKDAHNVDSQSITSERSEKSTRSKYTLGSKLSVVSKQSFSDRIKSLFTQISKTKSSGNIDPSMKEMKEKKKKRPGTLRLNSIPKAPIAVFPEDYWPISAFDRSPSKPVFDFSEYRDAMHTIGPSTLKPATTPGEMLLNTSFVFSQLTVPRPCTPIAKKKVSMIENIAEKWRQHKKDQDRVFDSKYDEERYETMAPEYFDLLEKSTEPDMKEFELKGSTKLWLGKDYVNFLAKDFVDLDDPFMDFIDRNTTPRMPWHDVACVVYGKSARDVARHFIQRWNFTKFAKAKQDVKIPLLLPKSYEKTKLHPAFRKSAVSCNVQIVRSASQWSAGIKTTEASIHEAYINIIENAKHYIYIENQFFISLVEYAPAVDNKISEAIHKRILRAHKNNETFRVYVVLPLLPAFEGQIGTASGIAIQSITHWNYRSICRGGYSLIEKLRKEVGAVENYISFFGLRKHSELNGQLVSELIYVHSKMMIADDNTVVIGSANINDRSMLGKRDSEMAVVVQDTQMFNSKMNGQPYRAGRFASSLRKRAFREHLGVVEGDDSIDLNDPVIDSFYKQCLVQAARNTKIFDDVFNCIPCDEVKSFSQIKEYVNKHKTTLANSDTREARSRLKKVKGYLVLFPLNFLCNEDLSPPTGTKEALMPIRFWT